MIAQYIIDIFAAAPWIAIGTGLYLLLVLR